jgi:excisionase family DNA binding protein
MPAGFQRPAFFFDFEMKMKKKRQHKTLIQTALELREAISGLLAHPECPATFTRRLSALHDDLEDLTVTPALEAQRRGGLLEEIARIIIEDNPDIAKLIETGRKPEIKRDTVYTFDEVASLLSVSSRTIKHAVDNGHLKADQIDSEPRILGSAIFQWLDEGGKAGRSNRHFEAGE